VNAVSNPSGRGDLTLSGFVAAACVAAALVCAAWWVSLQQSRAADWVSHTHEVLETIAKVRTALVDIQNGQRGFTISGREEDLKPYLDGRAQIVAETALLRQFVADNPAQRQRLAELDRELATRLASGERLIAARRSGGFDAAKAIVDTGLPAREMDRLRAVLNDLEAEEQRLLRSRLVDHHRRLEWFWVGMSLLVAGLIAVLAVLYLQVRRRRSAQQALIVEMRERVRIDEELQQLNRTLESQVLARTAELREANAGLLDAKLRLHDLSAQLIDAQEQERGRIARELHDDTGQLLSVIRMHLLRDGEGARARLPDCLEVVDAAIARIRAMALNLRPTMLDDLGLADAFQWLLDQHAKAAAWRVELAAQEIEAVLPAAVQTACFRIGQEALANAARHAQARVVKLELRLAGNELALTVEDDGIGFDLDRYRTPEERKKHFGLMSMTERAALVGGSLDVDTAPGRGTRIRARFPLAVEAAAAG
jgi:signal transduction histidine kinase